MSYLCMGCMKEYDEGDICNMCGFPKDYEQLSPYLPLRTIVNNRYIIGKVLRENSESVIYVGRDNFNGTPVIVREYFPAQICTRLSGSNVEINQGQVNNYFKMKKAFLETHSKIAGIKEFTSIVQVLDFFEYNNTAYCIETMEDYIPFTEYMERSGGILDWDTARLIFMPLLSALSKLNDIGVTHLGVAPPNLVVSAQGKIKILDFSVKQVHSANDIIIPKFYSGYSAPEQYEKNQIFSEETDIYSFTATLYYALTGSPPVESTKRIKDSRLLISANIVKKLPPHVIGAIANGLQTDRKLRVANFEDMRAQLSAAPTVKAIQEEIARPATTPIEVEEYKSKKVSNFSVGLISSIVALIIFSFVGFLWVQTNPFEGLFKVENPTNPTSQTDPTNPSNPSVSGDAVKIPDFVNKDLNTAILMSETSQEFNVYKVLEEEFSDTVPEGYIVSQMPKENTAQIRGTDELTISVTISKGPKIRQLPVIENKSVNEAAALLAQDGFVTSTEVQFSDSVAEGVVIGYTTGLEVGQEFEYGSAISIIVSMGPQPDNENDNLYF